MNTESNSYYDFQTRINTANKSTNERIDLMEVYFNQVLKNNTEFKEKLKQLENNNKDINNFLEWYINLPIYKIIWYKIRHKNFYNHLKLINNKLNGK